MRRNRANGIGAALLMLAGAAHAQEPAGTFKAVLDVGLVNVAGNTEVTTLNVGETVSFAWSGWVVAQTFSVVYGRTSGVTTASQWKAGIRGDRKYGERISTYLAGGFERNTFAGIDRRFEEAVGLAALLLKTERDELAVEAGGSLNQQRSTAGVRSSFPAARGAARFRHGFSNQAFVQQAVEALPNLEETDDLRLNAETQLVAPLSTQVGLKLSYVIRLDNLPEPGFRKTDRILTAGVQIVF